MGRVSLLKRISTAIRILRGTPAEDWLAYFGANGGRKTKAGPPINESSAMTISALYAALNFLGGVVASLPLRVRRNLPGGGSEAAVEHPLYDRLHVKPNDSGMTAWQWIYTSLLHKYLWGNWWTLVNRPSMELTPLLPDRTTIDSRLPMFVKTHNIEGKELPLIDRRDVLLIPHISLGGVTGKGIVHYARESLGLIKAQEEFASTFFGSGIKAGGFVQVPAGQQMNEETRKGLQKDFNEKYGQLGESWKAIFLSGGAEWKPNEIDAQKAQALESRLFSIAEISRWTGLAPHLLHDLSRATFSNIEELDLALVIFTLTPIVTQAEQAMNVTFFDDRERAAGYYVKFDLKGLLRGNLGARTAFYTAMLDRGVFNADNVLALEDMNPQPDGLGQTYVLPLNMMNKKMVVGSTSLELQPIRMRDVSLRRAVISASRPILRGLISTERKRLTARYAIKWGEYAKCLIADETAALRLGIEQWLTERSAVEFVTWLGKFYDDFYPHIDELVSPLLTQYSTDIIPVVLKEINSDADLNVQMQRFLTEYRDGTVRRHIQHSSSQLATALRDAEDAAIAIEEELQEWESSRADRIRLNESVRSEGAFARAVFIGAGITKLVWSASAKSCPWCAALNGKVVGIEEPFLPEGDFQPEGTDRPLTITSTHRHPPLHAGCICSIEASM